jgi:hypothetical protein
LAARLSEGLAVALSSVFFTASSLMVLAALLAVFLREIPLRRTNEQRHDGATSSP